MKLSKIRGFLNRNYFVKPEKIFYTWRGNDVRKYLLKMNFKQVDNDNINLDRYGTWLMCYKINVKSKTFSVCELQIDDDGILIFNDGIFERGGIEEWKSKLL